MTIPIERISSHFPTRMRDVEARGASSSTKVLPDRVYDEAKGVAPIVWTHPTRGRFPQPTLADSLENVGAHALSLGWFSVLGAMVEGHEHPRTSRIQRGQGVKSSPNATLE